MKLKVKNGEWYKWVIISAGLFVGISVSQAALIASYDLNGSSFAATTSDPDVSVSSIGTAGDWVISGSGGNLVITQNGADTIPTSTPDLAEYISFSVNPLSETVNFSSIGFDFGGENNMVATAYTLTVQLRSSVDGYAAVLGSDSRVIPANTTVASLTSTSFDLSGVPSLQSRTNTTQFRFYVYDNSTVTTKVLRARVDNITVNGSVIPEPVTIGMLGLGSLIVLTLRRMRS
jgi:hypothetical protein